MNADPPPRVLADGWYSWVIPSFRALTELTERWPEPVRRKLWRFGWLRAAVLAGAGSRFELLAVSRSDGGWRTLLLLQAVLGRRRKLVVTHFIDHRPRSAGWGAVLDRAWRPVDRWATRRAVAAAQVLSPGEVALYERRFATGPGRFHYLPFAWRMSGGDTRAPEPHGRRGVVAAGRAHCDWPTLFAAATGRSWPLTVICADHDRAPVDALNAAGTATVLSDVPHAQVRALLREAAISVICMHDAEVSHGHVRLCDAVDAGAAVVASRTRSLENYVEDGRTAVLVAPGDPAALRGAVESLLEDPGRRAGLASAAFERAAQWTWGDYLAAVEAFVRQSVRQK